MEVCKRCGAELPPGANFCPACGRAVIIKRGVKKRGNGQGTIKALDNGKYNSGGEFLPVTLNQGAGEGYFGPELGMAEVISEAFPDDSIFILKFTMSGYSLNHHWLFGYERASIYNAFRIYADTCLSFLAENGYTPSVDAIC